MIISDLSAWDGEAPLLLTLPLPANRANSRWHYMTESRIKRHYYDQCLVRYAKLPKVTLERARVTVRLYVHQKMDDDNLMARLKWPVDWLVIRGFIVDDKPDVLEWGPVTQEIDRKNQRIEIELEVI